jgi:hypothetical protein
MSRGKLMLEIVPEGSGPNIDERCRGVNLLHTFKTAAIEADTAEDGDGAATDAASPAGRGDGDAGFVAAPEHGGDFGGAGGPDDDAGPCRHGVRERTSQRDGPPVPARLGEGLGSEVDDGARTGKALEKAVFESDTRTAEPLSNSAGPGTDLDRGWHRPAVVRHGRSGLRGPEGWAGKRRGRGKVVAADVGEARALFAYSISVPAELDSEQLSGAGRRRGC